MCIEKLTSPNKNVALKLMLDENGNLLYEISKNGCVRYCKAPLGVIVGQNKNIFYDYSENAAIRNISEEKIENREFYVFGRREINFENCILYTAEIESHNIKYVLEAKVFDDGVAFRFVFPKEAGNIVFGEKTEFILPVYSKVYASFGCRQPGCNKALNGHDALCYESTYAEYDPAKKFVPTDYVRTKDWVNSVDYYNYVLMPMAVKYDDGTFGAIMEAEVFNYLGSSLRPFGNYRFGLNTSAGESQFKTFETDGSVITPWRIFTIADTLNDLYGNCIVNAVTRKSDYDFSFVKPGRSTWHWHVEFQRGNKNCYEMQLKYTDAAARLGFEYNIIDGGWQRFNEIIDGKEYGSLDLLKKIVDEGNKHNIGQIAWMGYINNELNPDSFEEKGNSCYSTKERIDACFEAGVKGVKVDFFRSESDMYSGVNMYEYVLDYCAQKHLICDLHGSTKPTGLVAKYPNELSREGIRGMENYFYNPICYPDIAYAFTTLTFVRGLAGHGDWTPFVQDGIGLASIILTDSPLMPLSATCEDLLNHPAREFIKSLPTSFDNTTILPESEFGEFISICKEKNGSYYFASINNHSTEIKQTLELRKYLPKGIYHMELCFDSDCGLRIENRMLQEKDNVDIVIPPYRGFAARFSKLEPSYFGGEVREAVRLKYFNGENVYYTLDGSDPENSPNRILYERKIEIKISCRLRACSIKDDRKIAEIDYKFNVIE